MLSWLWLSALVVVLDQVTKLWAEVALVGPRPLNILPHLDFRLAYNQGAAFSFLSDAGGWQRWLFSGLAVVISLVMVSWLRRLPREHKLLAAGFALVIGGAVGNLMDRLFYGHVVDFIDVYWDASLHWPAFNLADSAITLGMGLILLESFRGRV